MRLIIVTIDHINALLKNEDEDVCAPRRVSSFNFMNMSIHVEYLLELSKILPGSKVSRGQEAAEMTDDSSNVRCVKNEKYFKGGIIACTHRAGILVHGRSAI